MIGKRQVFAAVSIAVLATAWSAMSGAAVTATWYLGDDDVNPTSGATNDTRASEVGYSYDSSTTDDLSFTISGWYTTSDGGTLQDGSQYLVHWDGGLGLDRSNDGHGLDNTGGDEELIAIVFSEKVSLDSFEIGYLSGDSDMSILYQTDENADFNSNTLDGKSVAQLTSGTGAAYSLLGNVLDVPVNTPQDVSTAGGSTGALATDTATVDFPDLPAQQVFSKVWLIGAYLKNVVGNPDKYADAGDYVKFSALTASTQMPPKKPPHPGNGVPAPASALLLAFGLLQLSQQRRARRSFLK